MKNDSDPETKIQPEEHSATEEEEWGFPAQKRGISREAKVGISLIFVLLVAFGFVLYPKLFPDRSLGAQRDPLAGENAADGQDAVTTVLPNAVLGSSMHADPFADLGASRSKNSATGAEANSVSNDSLLETAQAEPPLHRADTDLHSSEADTTGTENSPKQATDEFLIPKPTRSPTTQTPKTDSFSQETVASADHGNSVAGSDFIRSSFSEQPEANRVISQGKTSKLLLMDDTLATPSAPKQSQDKLSRKPIETTRTTFAQNKPAPGQTSLLVQENKDTVTTLRIDDDSFAFAKPRPGANSGHMKTEQSKGTSHSLPNIEMKRKPSAPHPKASNPFDTLPRQTTRTHQTDRVLDSSSDTTIGPSASLGAEKKPKNEPAASKASRPSNAGKPAQSESTRQQPKANDERLGGFQPVVRQQAMSRTVVRQPNDAKSVHVSQPTSAKTRSATKSAVATSAPRHDADKLHKPENHKGNNDVKKSSTQVVDALKHAPSSEKLPPLQPAKKLPLVSAPPPSQNPPVLPSPKRSAIGDVAMHSQVTRHPADPAGMQPAKKTYVVKESDNFWIISKNVYGTSRYFQALALYNKSKISDPRRMRPGTRISTPSPNILLSSFPKLFPGHQSPVPSIHPSDQAVSGKESPGFFIGDDGQPSFRVGADDTLTDIAHRHLGRSSRWIQIYQLNRDRLENPHNLTIGKVLRLPSDASRIQFAQKPHNTR